MPVDFAKHVQLCPRFGRCWPGRPDAGQGWPRLGQKWTSVEHVWARSKDWGPILEHIHVPPESSGELRSGTSLSRHKASDGGRGGAPCATREARLGGGTRHPAAKTRAARAHSNTGSSHTNKWQGDAPPLVVWATEGRGRHPLRHRRLVAQALAKRAGVHRAFAGARKQDLDQRPRTGNNGEGWGSSAASRDGGDDGCERSAQPAGAPPPRHEGDAEHHAHDQAKGHEERAASEMPAGGALAVSGVDSPGKGAHGSGVCESTWRSASANSCGRLGARPSGWLAG